MRGVRTLSLAEYHTTPSVALTLTERDALQRLVPSLGVAPAAGTRNHYDLTPGSWVGAVALGDLAVEIRPKLPIGNLLFLIAYALDPRAWRDVPFDFAAASLSEAIVPAFVSLIRRATRRGLLHGYRTEEVALPAVRGRIRFADHARRRLGVAPPVELCFDDHTADVCENRLLKAALLRCKRLRLHSAGVAPLISHTLQLFDGVAVVDVDARRLAEIAFTRLNVHYRPALRLARLILEATGFDLGHGSVTGTSFLVDMIQVFEDFVVAALREALGLDERTFPQGLRWQLPDRSPGQRRRLPLDRAGALHLEPDLSWWEAERCIFVGDVKYKRTGPTGGEHPDLYQLLAYAVAAGLPSGLLVYAAGEGAPIAHRTRRAGKTLHVTTLDLTGSPEEILIQIDELANQIRVLRHR